VRDGIRQADPARGEHAEELIGKLLEAADMLEDNLEASPQHATVYFAMASRLREAARALSLLLNKPCEPPVPRAGRVRPPSAGTR
jgi:hypothetical protein